MELLVVCGRVEARRQQRRGSRRGMLLGYVLSVSFPCISWITWAVTFFDSELTMIIGRTTVSQNRRIEYRCNGIGQVEHFQRQEAQGEGQGRGSGCRSSQATSLDIHSYTIQCVTAI